MKGGMGMKKIMIGLMLLGLTLSGCSYPLGHASSIVKPAKYQYKSFKIKGTFNQTQDLIYKAGEIAFPEVPLKDIQKTKEGINIDRYWFWRGDSTIVVTLKLNNDNLYIINAKSVQNSKRLNPSLIKLDESEYYISILYKTYENKEISKQDKQYNLYLKLKKKYEKNK